MPVLNNFIQKMVVSNDDDTSPEEINPESLEPAPGEVLGELLQHLEDYTPTVPDALAEKYLHSAGFEAVDPRIVRIISVTAQKFISDIANDALQHCKTRSSSQHSGSHGSNKVSVILSSSFKYVSLLRCFLG